MSWKLVFALSLFGLAMGVATVFVIPTKQEPWAWLAIFAVSALVIAKRAPGKYFLHGVCVSFVDGLWITAAHVALFDQYVARHSLEISTIGHFAQIGSPKMMLAVAGPVAGLASGVVLGLVAYVFSKFVVSAHSEYAGW